MLTWSDPNNCLKPHKEMFPSTHQLHIFDPFYWLDSLDVQGRRLPEDVFTCTSSRYAWMLSTSRWPPVSCLHKYPAEGRVAPGHSVSHAQGRCSRFNLLKTANWYQFVPGIPFLNKNHQDWGIADCCLNLIKEFQKLNRAKHCPCCLSGDLKNCGKRCSNFLG